VRVGHRYPRNASLTGGSACHYVLGALTFSAWTAHSEGARRLQWSLPNPLLHTSPLRAVSLRWPSAPVERPPGHPGAYPSGSQTRAIQSIEPHLCSTDTSELSEVPTATTTGNTPEPPSKPGSASLGGVVVGPSLIRSPNPSALAAPIQSELLHPVRERRRTVTSRSLPARGSRRRPLVQTLDNVSRET